MKKTLFNFIFKKQLEQLYRVMAESNRKVKLIDDKMANNELKYGIAKRIFYLFPSAKIVGIEINKNGEELFVVEKITQSGITIYLFGESYQGICGLPRISSTILKDYSTESRSVHIDDIQNEDNNIGNGSILMKYFILAAKREQMVYIDGWLSDIDIDHFNRLEYYYKKFGFDVNFNDSRTNGNIKLVL